jgi:type II secretory pathway pseudopilin PulG
VPKNQEKNLGFSPCGLGKDSVAKALGYRRVAARLKPCPDTKPAQFPLPYRAARLPREGERGFALLLVFLMAAVIGITLYAELPRVAIQSQRAKEQLLVERGEQFKRAIQLFLRANKGTRFPADLDDLDRGYNNLRFLRHRYKDPMTGKDEWRIIHMQGGVLTDSLLNKPKDSDKQEASTLGQNISAQLGLGETASAGQAQPNAMSRRRPSEGGTGGGLGPDGQPIQPADQTNGTQPGVGPDGTPLPSQAPGTPGMPGGPGSPFGAAPGSAPFPGMPGAPGQFPGQFPGQPPGMPGGMNAGNTGDSGSTVGGYGSTVGNGAATGGLNPANAGSAANPMVPGQNTAAQNMLQNLLGTPRPNGAPPGIGQGQGTVIGGGMAGVASKMDAEGLMVYNDRTNYKEWEFVYDPSKDRPRQDPRNMLVGNQMGTPSTPTPGSATPSSQPGMFSQPGQSGMSGQVVTNAPGGTSGTSGLTGSNGQTGTPTSAANSGQGAPIDIRPGKK